MASDLEEEMVSESESSVDINDLLPREGHVSFNQYGSIVAENESPGNQEIVEEAGASVDTEVVRKYFTPWPICFIYKRNYNFSHVYRSIKSASQSAVLLV